MTAFTPQRRVELMEVMGVLRDTFGNTTRDGVVIERIHGSWGQDGVRYIDPEGSKEPIREMTATAYAAEFYKVAGGSLDSADFDEVIRDLSYIGNVLGGIVSREMDIEGLKVLARGEE